MSLASFCQSRTVQLNTFIVFSENLIKIGPHIDKLPLVTATVRLSNWQRPSLSVRCGHLSIHFVHQNGTYFQSSSDPLFLFSLFDFIKYHVKYTSSIVILISDRGNMSLTRKQNKQTRHFLYKTVVHRSTSAQW